ncbi:TonB-dependent receptor [Sphingomonas sp. R647]|uniref:TonB-dependent receptor n=1 Tax=Sphingomonas sp. R647 TaxID=2875233 RepID=UPI001CD1EA69|nr:TonB-dependent receptor [Sphingomonas sp. R647]MCA1197217.1 TonB-dependent receptor [Sphingomonas sp. R647]
MKSSRSANNGLIRGSRLRAAAAALAWSSAGTVLAIGLAVPAQAQVNASLRGKVTAEGGVSLVTIVNVDTGFTRTNTPSADGSYQFTSLPPGNYRLEVTTPAGVRRTDEFNIAVAQNAVFDFDLATPDITTADGGEEVIVTGNRIQSMQGGEVGTTISSRLLEQLPQNNRNFLGFADLAPGVQFIEDQNGQNRLQGGAQDSRTINVFIDGVGQKDYVLKNGIAGQDSSQGNPFPQLAVGEYRVISSNYKAEFDQVSSVAITAVTKSGTNRFEGSGFIDFTSQDLREARPSEIFPTNATGKQRSRDLQFGGSLGGPIIKDMLHFFVTYEGKRRLFPADIEAGLSLPATFFPAEYQGVFGQSNNDFNSDLFFGKLSFSPTSRDLFELSGTYRDETGNSGTGGINTYETRTLLDVKVRRGLARWQHSADNWTNEFKVAYEDVSWNPRPATEAPRFVFRTQIRNPNNSLSTGDILSVGGGRNFQDKGQTGWEVSDNFTYTGFKGHTLQFGVKAKWVELNTIQLNSFNPEFRFFTPLNAPFNQTLPYTMNFQALLDGFDPQLRSNNFQFGAYVQDEWVVNDRLTLNLGIRWDFERTPAFENYVHQADQVAAVQPNRYPNLNNANYDINDYISTGTERKPFLGAFQPRVGFTYDLDEEGRFAVFGGYGKSYDRNQFDFIQQELTQGIASGRTFNFNVPGDTINVCTPSATCIPWNPAYLTAEGREALVRGLPAGAGREVRFINNDLKTPYSHQYSLGVRGQFNLLNLEVGYSYVTSHDGFVYLLGNRRADGSFFPATGNAASPFGISPAPFGNIIIGDNGIETRAHTGFFKLQKRYTAASRWSFDATYTWTRGTENRQFGETFSLDYPSIDDYPFTRSNGVRTHRLVMAGTVDIPFDITLAGKFQISSPRWLKSFTSIAGDPLSRDVVAVETEGNGDRWGYRQMDLSATKYFKLPILTDRTRVWARIDILNLFNDRNYNSFNTVTGARNLNAFGTDGPPRTIKVATGFNF